MKRILLTGMSGTGKSTLIRELAARGYKAVDADYDGWSEMRTMPGQSEPEWVWREDRMRELLAEEDAEVLFVSGCAANQGQFYSQFDEVVLLIAPPAVIVDRLRTRTTNSFGKAPEELAKVLADQEAVEPLLRRRSTFEIDVSQTLEQVLAAVLGLVDSTGNASDTTR